MMEPSPVDFRRFAESLTPAEKTAVQAWLDMGATLFREFELYGAVPSQMMPQSMTAVVNDFGKAMEKAVPCRQLVFRGLSAGRWRPPDIEYLLSVLQGPENLSIPIYASASAAEAIGRSFCRVGADDEERHLAVLMRIRPLTARWLRPFEHRSMDEHEVVLLKGTSYRREAARRMPDPKEGLEFWEV